MVGRIIQTEECVAEGAAWLARGVARSTSLQSLSLAWNRLGPDGLIALASAVSSCATLTSLNLDNNAVCGINDFGQGTYTDAGLTALAEALRRRPQLTALNLSNNAELTVYAIRNELV